MLSYKKRLPAKEFSVRGYFFVKTPYFNLKIKPNGLSENRIGIVIGRAAEKTAVRRNFWKRQAREFFKGVPAQSRDFVLSFTPQVKTLTGPRLKKELADALNKIPH